MKTLYLAANALEAHMLIDVLRQQNLVAQLQGEHLPGAVGELPGAGLVRLVVEDEDYAAARAAIERWEAEHPPEPARASAGLGTRRWWLGWWAGCLTGLALASAVGWWLLHMPGDERGIDYDRDGLLDERWTYAVSGRPLRREDDRNLDHRVDWVAHFDEHGLITSAEADDDFDGVFETRQRYRDGQLALVETDTDGDRFPDLRADFVDGVLERQTHLNPATGLAQRIEHFRLGRLVWAEIDSDGDGLIDTRLDFAASGAISERRAWP